MRLLFIILLLVLSTFTFGQEYSTKSFSVNDGLPSSQVYDILQDGERNIWIATDVGVSKYDGYVFTNYTQKEGLADNIIVSMELGEDGSILFQGFSKKLCIYDGDSIYAFPENEELLELLGTNNIASVSYKSSSFFEIGVSVSCESKNQFIKYENGRLDLRKTDNSGVYFSSNELWSSTFCRQNKVYSSDHAIEVKELIGSPSVILNDKNGFYYLSKNSVGYVSSSGHLIQTLKGFSSRAILIDEQNNLWVGTFGKGVSVFLGGDLSKEPIEVLKEETISAIFQDEDGNLWLGGMSKGLWFINNPFIQSFNELAGSAVKRVSILKNELVVCDQSNLTTKIRFESWNAFEIESEQLDFPVSEIIVHDNSFSYLSESASEFAKSDIFKGNGISYCKSSKAERMWVGEIYSFSEYVNGQRVFNSSEIGFQERVNCLIEISSNELFIGSLSGLFVFDGKAVRPVEGTRNIRIEDVLLKDGILFFATRGSGLGKLEKGVVSFITETDGLSSDFCSRLALDNRGRLWVAGNKGISILKGNKIQVISSKDGLPSNEINDIGIFYDKVILASNQGLSIIHPEYFEKERKPLEISNLVARNDDLTVNPGDKLSYSARKIVFTYSATDYRNNDPVLYRYRLLPDSNWTENEQVEITYGALSFGNYQFEVGVKNQNGEWSPVVKAFPFQIEKPVWFRTWFVLLMVLVSALVIYFFVKYRESQIRRKSAAENELSALKIKALSSQMNPHFIFNSLNSIQNFIIDSDLRKSNKYLTMFAKLMRLVLNNSDKTFVPMKDVIGSLELYMGLEKLRFNDKFDFIIEIDKSINVGHTEIPAMLMQPFVENAILHGILPKNEKGKISLRISTHDNSTLKCIIEDDGVGRDFLKDKKSTKHKSQGLKITKERLLVFESYFKNKFSFDIHDLKTTDGKAKGTQVELFIPFQ